MTRIVLAQENLSCQICDLPHPAHRWLEAQSCAALNLRANVSGNVGEVGRTGTISVMFTDLVGSTSLMDKHADRLWDEHRRALFGVLREALAAHGGTEVKHTGDGLMAVFGGVIDMVECAAAMQLTAATPRLGVGAGRAIRSNRVGDRSAMMRSGRQGAGCEQRGSGAPAHCAH